MLALLPGCTGLESSSPNGQAADARWLPIIDMHMHATPIEAYPSEWGGTPPFRNPVTGELSAATTNEAIMAASGEKTVARHVSNIFDKLEVSSRSGATAWAFQHHLI